MTQDTIKVPPPNFAKLFGWPTHRMQCGATECLLNMTAKKWPLAKSFGPVRDKPRCTANAAELIPNSPKCPKYIKATGRAPTGLSILNDLN